LLIVAAPSAASRSTSPISAARSAAARPGIASASTPDDRVARVARAAGLDHLHRGREDGDDAVARPDVTVQPARDLLAAALPDRLTQPVEGGVRHRRRPGPGDPQQVDRLVPPADDVEHPDELVPRLEAVRRPRLPRQLGPLDADPEGGLGGRPLAPVLVGPGQQVAPLQLGRQRTAGLRPVDDRLQCGPQLRGVAQLAERRQRRRRRRGGRRQVVALGQRERLGAGRLRLVGHAAPVQQQGPVREDAGPQRRVVVGHEGERLVGGPQRVQLGVVDDAHGQRLGGEHPRPGGGGRPGREAVQLLLGDPGGAVRAAGRGQRHHAGLHDGGRVDALGRGQLAEQGERTLVVLGGLVGTADGGRLVAGADARDQRGRQVVRVPGVAGELGGRAERRGTAVAVGQHLDVPAVQPHPLAGQQVVVHGLAEQRVPEPVGALAGDEDVLLDGMAQRLVEGLRGQVGDGGEQVVADPAARHGGGAYDGPGRVAQPVEPDEEDVGELVGDPVVRAAGGADELLDEERVALGAGDDVLPLAPAHRGVDRGDQVPDVVVAERVEGEAADPGHARPLGHLAAQGVPAVQVVGAVGRDDRDRADEGPAEEVGEQVAGGLVGPVGVLDHDQRGRLVGDRLEQAVHGREELAAVDGLDPLVGGALAPGREQAGESGVELGDALDHIGELRHETVEHLGEGQVGQGAVAEVEAVAGVHLPPAGAGERGELLQQPGLSDARVAGEQDVLAGAAVDARSARSPRDKGDAEQRGEFLELGVSSDQDPFGHVLHDPLSGGDGADHFGDHHRTSIEIPLRRGRDRRSRAFSRRTAMLSRILSALYADSARTYPVS